MTAMVTVRVLVGTRTIIALADFSSDMTKRLLSPILLLPGWKLSLLFSKPSYLICRFCVSTMALIVITFAGTMASFLAATTGILQNNLKRAITYSTCSQLGNMIFACGISNPGCKFYHSWHVT
ncbi:UNVERIFIED_CONTAM: NADH-ubiquinone oxidoreductase chain 5 [Sesamum indicum]